MAGVVGSVGLAASGLAGVVAAGVPNPKVLVAAVPGLSVLAAGVVPKPNVLEVPLEPNPKVLAVLLPDVPKPKLLVPVAGVPVDGAVVAATGLSVPVDVAAGVVVVPEAGVVVAGFVVSVLGEVVAPKAKVLVPVVAGLSPLGGAPKANVDELPNVVPAGLSVDGAVPGLVPGEPAVPVVAAGLVASVWPNVKVFEVLVAGLSPGFLSPPVGPPNESVLAPRDDNEPNPPVPVDGAVVTAAGLLVSDVVPKPNEFAPGLLESVVPKPNDPEVPRGLGCSAGLGETFTAPGRGPVVST